MFIQRTIPASRRAILDEIAKVWGNDLLLVISEVTPGSRILRYWLEWSDRTLTRFWTSLSFSPSVAAAKCVRNMPMRFTGARSKSIEIWVRGVTCADDLTSTRSFEAKEWSGNWPVVVRQAVSALITQSEPKRLYY